MTCSLQRPKHCKITTFKNRPPSLPALYIYPVQEIHAFTKFTFFFISSYQYEDIWRYNAVYILICNILGYVHARFFWIVCFIVMLQMFLAVYVYIYIYTHQILIAHAHTHMCIYIYICKFKFTETHLLRIIEVVHYVCYMFANNIKGNYQ